MMRNLRLRDSKCSLQNSEWLEFGPIVSKIHAIEPDHTDSSSQSSVLLWKRFLPWKGMGEKRTRSTPSRWEGPRRMMFHGDLNRFSPCQCVVFLIHRNEKQVCLVCCLTLGFAVLRQDRMGQTWLFSLHPSVLSTVPPTLFLLAANVSSRILSRRFHRGLWAKHGWRTQALVLEVCSPAVGYFSHLKQN